MADPLVTDMTVDDLKALIAEIVDARLRSWQQRPRDTRSALGDFSSDGSSQVDTTPRLPDND